MSAARNRYFRRRRALLRRRKVCVRCGTNRARKGHVTCALCELEKKMKRPEAKASDEKRKARLAARAALLEEARQLLIRD